MQIRFIRFHPDVKIPERRHPSDTGADIYMLEGGTLKPHQTLVLKTGFGVEIPNGHTGRMQVRTSVAKQGIMIQGCAIDAGYVGELSIILHNISSKTFTWEKGDRLGYIEVYPTQYPTFVEDMPKSRGTGAFGSTGK
jgi:dUTP pyrophosphatase